MDYVVLEERRTLPNGVRVQRSIYPKEQLEFNRWARELNVSGSYVAKREEPDAMRMLREYGLKREGVLGFM
jgi:hypothetical protein